MAKIVRVLIYEGTEEALQKTIANSGVPIYGVRESTNLTIKSVVLESTLLRCFLCNSITANSTDCLCKNCKEQLQKGIEKLKKENLI